MVKKTCDLQKKEKEGASKRKLFPGLNKKEKERCLCKLWEKGGETEHKYRKSLYFWT
jgi:hypothetical protein